MDLKREIPVSCNRDCISGCPLTAEIENGRLVRIKNSPYRSAYMSGCPRGFLFPAVLYHPDRVTVPLIRTGERGEGIFREAEWEEALEYVAGGLEGIREKNGPDSIMFLGGSGACRGIFHNTAYIPRRFFAMYGGFTDTAGTFSSEATDFIKPYMYGTPYVGVDIKTVLHSTLVILWGFNAADTRFGAETEAVLNELKERDVPIVVIDPRRTRTVRRYASEWLPVYPGSDAALMLALLYVILSRGLEDRRFIDRYSTGFAALEAYVLGKDGGPAKSPAWAEKKCGLPAGRIEKFAMQYAGARPAALLPGLSIQRTWAGEEADRLGGVLQLVLGNVGRRGGSTGSGQWNTLEAPRCGKLPVPENPAGSAVPVYQWADAVIGGKEKGWPADIRCLYNVGGNYLVQGSDMRKNREAFRSVYLTVTHDYFLTDTARFSDVVLPVTTFLERRDILRTSMNYLLYSEKAVDEVGSARNDWDIFSDLACRLGFGREFTEGKTADQWIENLAAASEIEDMETFYRKGIYAGRDQERVGLSDFISDPEGCPLNTASGRIEIDIPAFEEIGGARIPVWRPMQQTDDFPLNLITPHEMLRNNSQFSNIAEFRKGIDETVWIHPRDAELRNIASGDPVLLRSPQGQVRLTARVTGDIMQGVVSCSQGAWTTPATGEGPGSAGINMVTSSEPTLPSRGARTHSVKVEICLEKDSPTG